MDIEKVEQELQERLTDLETDITHVAATTGIDKGILLKIATDALKIGRAEGALANNKMISGHLSKLNKLVSNK